jgi:ATP-dependent protease HslVU (ClpYQ) ATPase subunit
MEARTNMADKTIRLDAVAYAKEVILDVLLPALPGENKETVTRRKFRLTLEDGLLDDKYVDISYRDITPEPEMKIAEESWWGLMVNRADVPSLGNLEAYLKLVAEAKMAGRPWNNKYLRLKISEALARLEEKYMQEHRRSVVNSDFRPTKH